jgi:hypothetical protein
MTWTVLAALVGMAPTLSAIAADSVVVGRGISNAYVADAACPEGSSCMDSLHVWVLKVRRTVSGPVVKCTVRALATQHIEATTEFVKSVELFVLRPIDDAAIRNAYGAEYRLVSLSPRYESDKYCLTVNPNDVGLRLESSQIAFDSESGVYCFDRRTLKQLGIGAEKASARDAARVSRAR